jgi:hypothetical protein
MSSGLVVTLPNICPATQIASACTEPITSDTLRIEKFKYDFRYVMIRHRIILCFGGVRKVWRACDCGSK